jgi:hypothetical protein
MSAHKFKEGDIITFKQGPRAAIIVKDGWHIARIEKVLGGDYADDEKDYHITLVHPHGQVSKCHAYEKYLIEFDVRMSDIDNFQFDLLTS